MNPPAAAAHPGTGLGGTAADRPPQLLTVVDTEEEFDWSQPFNRAATGVTHFRRIGDLQAVFEAQGVRPVYAVDYPVASQARAVDALAGIFAEGRAVLGAHLHPWVTPPFVEDVNRHNSYPGNLPAALERDKLATLIACITRAFAQRPVIYSAGRYGIGPNTFAILEQLGFTIDVSPMPAFDYRGDGGPDFSRHGLQPSWVGPSRSVLCIPNTSALVGLLPRLNLVGVAHAGLHPRVRPLRVPGVLSRLRLVERIALTPEGYSLEELCRLTMALHRAGQRLFTLRLHSPSVATGYTPYVRDETDRRELLSTIGRYVDFFRRELNGETSDPLAVSYELGQKRPPAAAAAASPAAAYRLVPPAAASPAAARPPGIAAAGPRPAAEPPAPPRPVRPSFTVSPIYDDDLAEVAGYWNRHLNPGIPCDTWIEAFRHPWMPDKPNNGFLLRANGRLIGALGAIYSRQEIDGQPRVFCNLTSLVIDPVHRARAMDLLSALLAQKGLCFTDFTPTPTVAKMLRLLRFTELPSGEYIVPHVPLPPVARGVRAIEDAAELDRRLTGAAAQLWRDHRAIPWLRHLAVGDGERWCLVFWKPAAIKSLPAANLLGVSDRALAQAWLPAIGGHLLLRHRVLASRVDAHLWPKAGHAGIARPVTMPHLVRATPPLPADRISFLYSELAALPI